MATGFISHIGEFDPDKEQFENYINRLELWMTVNKVETPAKSNVLLALIRPSSFELLVNMSALAEPTAKSFDALKELLMNY